MTANVEGWLPALVLLNDFGGNWQGYLDALYNYFKQDFINSSPCFRGQTMRLKRHPFRDGKEATFWHFIQSGKVEEERLPDLRRCERIRWPRPIIGGAEREEIKCWTNRRGNEDRILLALADFSYIVVIAVRSGYFLPWTAYCVEREHQRKKLQKEYEAYIITEAAPKDGLVTPSTHGR